MRPPLACTASVTGRQAATCSSVYRPGVPGLDCPTRLGCTPSLTINPAVARWA